MTGNRDALERVVAALDLTAADEAAVTLARQYADRLDANPDDLASIGNQFRLILADLRLRGAPKGGAVPDDDDPGSATFDELRAGQEAAG